ncbi:MAG: hypothetical protein KKE17_11320 [Proteobacteria bacterium]|nr:hypothetical protein [Pseudomonadota bacterium]MBU1710584.1 hypothetical protein [Pseudomonadota bacterium]
MKLLVFSAGKRQTGEKLAAVVLKKIATEEVEVIDEIGRFAQRLIDHKSDADFAVIILTSTGQDLETCFAVQELLYDVRLIIALHACDDESIARAHLFRPRFLTSNDANDFSDIQAVLVKMQNTMTVSAFH